MDKGVTTMGFIDSFIKGLRDWYKPSVGDIPPPNTGDKLPPKKGYYIVYRNDGWEYRSYADYRMKKAYYAELWARDINDPYFLMDVGRISDKEWERVKEELRRDELTWTYIEELAPNKQWMYDVAHKKLAWGMQPGLSEVRFKGKYREYKIKRYGHQFLTWYRPIK
jgi:hypothetical protein